MAIIIKSLGAGTIVASGTPNLYTVPAAKSAIINNVRLANGNASVTVALNLQVKPSGSGTTARRIYDKNFTIPANQSKIIEDVVTLGQGDALQLDVASGTAPSIGYMVNGIERE